MADGRNRTGDGASEDSGVAHFTMSAARRRNAVDAAFLERLNQALDNAEQRGAAVLTLRSTVPGVFCSGADLSLDDADRAAVSDGLYGAYQRIITSPVIVVADVQGAAVGGGAQLALAADICMVTPEAWFRFAGVGHGLAAAAWALVRTVGRQAAAEMCLTMRKVGAEEALRLGLATPRRDDLATEIARNHPEARTRLKRLLNSDLHEPLELERTGNRENWTGGIAGLRR